MNQPELAARLSGIAQAILERSSFQYEPIDRAEFDRHIAIARHQIGDVRSEELITDGRDMSMGQAIEYARETFTL